MNGKNPQKQPSQTEHSNGNGHQAALSHIQAELECARELYAQGEIFADQEEYNNALVLLLE